MLDEMERMVFEILNNDNSGHGMDHILRVKDLSLRFAKAEDANREIVEIASLLHDVDDYKIVGIENAKSLTHAKRILNKVNVSEDIQIQILNIIQNMSYSKSLKGIRPTTLEGKIVSDADMCDALGAHGIIRSIVYAVSDKGNGIIFDNNIYPNMDITA